ncbi:hypothetical protein [Catellatospora sp. NPDC049133]|jgi:hypothetical protein|uniref:Imm32 family immunity protein n=1 Tax=Catellatospora sp. NPDC049133 TaxID=3155499 RepID=UPI0033C9DC2C
MREPLQVRHSASTAEVEIQFTDAAAFDALVALLRAGTGHVYTATAAQAAPYERLLAGVLVVTRPGRPAEFTVRGDRLAIGGDARHLTTMADALAGVGELPPGRHEHVEHYPDHPYLGPDSLPVVVARAATGSS